MVIDHVLVSVPALQVAIDDFTRAGFKVYPGTAKGRAYNAMVYLADGTFIELVDVSTFPRILSWLHKYNITRLFGAMGKRVGAYAATQKRILDLALYAPDIQAAHLLIKQSVPVSGLYRFKRVAANGVRLTWQLFAPYDVNVPFVMSDYSPARLPDDAACVHANGIQGIARVRYRVPGVADISSRKCIAAWSTLLGVSPQPQDNGDVLFMLPTCALFVTAGVDEGIVVYCDHVTPEMVRLGRYGVMVQLRVAR